MAVSCYALNSLVIMKSGEEEEKSGGGGGRSKTPPVTRRQVLPGLVRGSERHSSYCPLPARSGGSSGGSSSCSSGGGGSVASAFLFPSIEPPQFAEEASTRGTPRRLSSPSWACRLGEGLQASPPVRSPSPGSARILQRELQNVQVTQKVGLFEAQIQAQSSGAATFLLKSPRPSRRRSPSPSPSRTAQPLGGPPEQGLGRVKGAESPPSRLETTGRTSEWEAEKGAGSCLAPEAEKAGTSGGAPVAQGALEMENRLATAQCLEETGVGEGVPRAQDSSEAENWVKAPRLQGSSERDAGPKADELERANGISRAQGSGNAEARLGSREGQGLEKRSGSPEGRATRELQNPRKCQGLRAFGEMGSEGQAGEGDARRSEGAGSGRGASGDRSFLEGVQGRSGFRRGQGSDTMEKPLGEHLAAGDPPCLVRTDCKERSSSRAAAGAAGSGKQLSVPPPPPVLMAKANGAGLQEQHPGEQPSPGPSVAEEEQQEKLLVEGDCCCGGGSSIPAVIVTDLGAQEEEEAGGSSQKNMPIRKLSSSSASSTGFSSSWEESEEDISSDPERALDQSPAFLQTLDKPRVVSYEQSDSSDCLVIGW
ncbi:hypothetical protein lerEdw1_018833 [Lerista edwardsae]|nr:hypothetical protein lerEdw1_018833 [Lerista edwardsae]